MLENYYDRTRADEWDAVFEGTDAGRKPTDDRSRYVILRFNFSAFDDTLDGEKVVHAFLAAHFSQWKEREGERKRKRKWEEKKGGGGEEE